MVSAGGRYVISFNGEIYNFRELRASSMATASSSGASDTEVLLAGIERWGVIAALQSCRDVRDCALGSSRSHPRSQP
jgi:asparagine synthase (glutamine-hydrolysing)